MINSTLTGQKAMASPVISIKPEEMTFPLVEVWPNQNTQRDYVIHIDIPEFTSVCPMTGLPDFGRLLIDYVPDAGCLELKALKYYMLAYRNVGIFYENVVNRILDDLVTAANPKLMQIQGCFTARGGISTQVLVSHVQPGYTPPVAIAATFQPVLR
jgi:7-cyano-7-deazaguanine reductase